MKVSLVSEQLLLTLWVGSLCAIGYIAVPMAFATLGDVSLAGTYAGKLFTVVNLLGLGCGIALLVSKLTLYGLHAITLWRFWLIIVMLILTLIFNYYLQPEIASVKQLMLTDENSIERFSFLHKLTKGLYFIISLLGLTLVVSQDKVEV